MPAAKKPAIDKAAAARAETNGAGPKSVVWRGVSFTLADKLEADIAWTMAEVDEGSGVRGVIRLVNALLGGDDQVATLRAKLREDAVPLSELDEVLEELVGKIFAAYGTEPGESTASPSS